MVCNHASPLQDYLRRILRRMVGAANTDTEEILQDNSNTRQVSNKKDSTMPNVKRLPYNEQLLCENWKQKRDAIVKRDNGVCRICGKTIREAGVLNVHHRYYIHDSLAWEYVDSALITLCPECHKLVHDTLGPRAYNRSGTILIPLNLTPCSRCGGAGYFPEYRHIQGGVCFRCRGDRYEELIGKDHVDINDFILSDDYTCDTLSPTADQHELRMLFNKGLSYQKGENGFPMSDDEAYAHYRKAALMGHARAQNNCGVILLKRKKPKLALQWFVYAAMQGNANAQKNISIFLKKTKPKLSESWLKISQENEKRNEK